MGSDYSVVAFVQPGVTSASALRSGGEPDEEATRRLVEGSHPDCRIVGVYGSVLSESINTEAGSGVEAAVFPGLALLFSSRWDLDRPSELRPGEIGASLPPGYSTVAAGVVQNAGWAGVGVWDAEHRLVRSVSLAGGPTDHELVEMVGSPLPEEEPWWFGSPEGHPQTLVQAVLLSRIGFDFEHEGPGDPPVDLDEVPTLAFSIEPRDS